MELESLHPRPASGQTSHVAHSRESPFAQLWSLTKLYMEYYPKVTAAIFFTLIGFFFHFLMSNRGPAIVRNSMSHHYAQIDVDYNFKAAKIDHWCLFGGDEDCNCEAFTDPISREEKKGWLAAHTANKRRIDENIDYDVVFLGDDTTEMWNGMFLNVPVYSNPNGKAIHDYWNKTFTRDGGGELDGLALGIAEDTVR
jgi:hypothetical protein